MEGLQIGELAKRAQVNPKTIRYYEQVGLMPRPRRDDNGYRLYSEKDLNRLQLIRRAKSLDLSLEVAKQIVSYAVDGRCTILQRNLADLLQEKIRAIDSRRAELDELREQLRRLYHELSQKLLYPHRLFGSGQDSCQCLDVGERR